jgi:hypothetical protein
MGKEPENSFQVESCRVRQMNDQQRRQLRNAMKG